MWEVIQKAEFAYIFDLHLVHTYVWLKAYLFKEFLLALFNVKLINIQYAK